jgi:hypothetical protein
VLSIEPAPRMTPACEEDLVEALVSRCNLVFGPTWTVETTTLAAASGRDWTARGATPPFDALPSPWQSYDKVFVVYLAPGAGDVRVTARELDVATRLWGTPRTGEAAQPVMLADAAFRAVLAAFSPLGRIETVDGKTVIIRVQGGGLPLRDPAVSPLGPGTVFLPVVRRNDRTGAPKSIQPVEWTWLVAESASQAEATCRVYSGLRSPLTARKRGRIEQYALAIAPPGGSTRLVLYTGSGDRERPLAGYDVYSQAPGVETTMLLGRTDREGAIVVGPAAETLRVLLVKNGTEVLARLPLVPGYSDEARAPLADDDERLAVEGFIIGLQQSLVDTIVRREVLLLRIRKRIEQKQMEEARKLLAELRQLETRERFTAALVERRKSITTTDPRARKEINQLFNDTQKLIDSQLDPRQIADIEKELGG